MPSLDSFQSKQIEDLQKLIMEQKQVLTDLLKLYGSFSKKSVTISNILLLLMGIVVIVILSILLETVIRIILSNKKSKKQDEGKVMLKETKTNEPVTKIKKTSREKSICKEVSPPKALESEMNASLETTPDKLLKKVNKETPKKSTTGTSSTKNTLINSPNYNSNSNNVVDAANFYGVNKSYMQPASSESNISFSDKIPSDKKYPVPRNTFMYGNKHVVDSMSVGRSPKNSMHASSFNSGTPKLVTTLSGTNTSSISYSDRDAFKKPSPKKSPSKM